MEGIIDLIFNAENVRMLVILAFGFYGYMLVKGQMKDSESSLGKRIDGVELSLNKRIDGVELSLGKRIDSLDKKIDGVESSLGKRIDGVEKRIDGVEKGMLNLEHSLLKAMDEKIAFANQSLYAQLKANDFAHLNNTIEALTFTLEKNGFLKREDKEYIDGRLDK